MYDPYQYYYWDTYYLWRTVFTLTGTFISSTERAYQQEIGLGINYIHSSYQPSLGFSFVNYSWFTFTDTKRGLYRVGLEYTPCFWLPDQVVTFRLGVAFSFPFVSTHPGKRHELLLEMGIFPLEYIISYGLYPSFVPFVSVGWNKRWIKVKGYQ
jgi:hypothetical protein